MRPIQVHPLSALIGAAVLAVPLVLTSLQGASATPYPHAQLPIPVTVKEMPPDPHDMVVIREEEGPYVVPTGKLFVLTGIGTNDAGHTVSLRVDGAIEAFASESSVRSPLSINAVPVGFTAPAGSSIVPHTGSLQMGRAWGYVVDA